MQRCQWPRSSSSNSGQVSTWAIYNKDQTMELILQCPQCTVPTADQSAPATSCSSKFRRCWRRWPTKRKVRSGIQWLISLPTANSLAPLARQSTLIRFIRRKNTQEIILLSKLELHVLQRKSSLNLKSTRVGTLLWLQWLTSLWPCNLKLCFACVSE